MSVYFVASAEPDKAAALENSLRTKISDLIRTRDLGEIFEILQNRAPGQNFVILPLAGAEQRRLNEIIEIAPVKKGQAFFIIISDDIPGNDYKRLIRTGNAEWVSTSAAAQEIPDIISKQANTGHVYARQNIPVVVSFVPSAGGVGTATLAVETAAYLKTRMSSRFNRICVIDLDFQNSHVCDHLDIGPRLKIEEISANPERLDDQLFNIFVSNHSSGFDVIAAPRSKFNMCDLNIGALDKLFDMILARYGLVLIDLPLMWFAWTSQVIVSSDSAIVIGTNTVPGLRLMAETLAAVRNVCRMSCQVAAVINRYERRFLGGIGGRQQTEKVLGLEKIFYIPNDAVVQQSINIGSPIISTVGSRKIIKQVAALADFCTALKGHTQQRTSEEPAINRS